MRLEINQSIAALLEQTVGIDVPEKFGIDIKGSPKLGLDVKPSSLTPGVGIDVDTKVKVGIDTRPPITIELDARRALDGSIMIYEHEDLDIVIMPDKKKIMAFAKATEHEGVYEAQDRLGKFLTKSGVIDPSSVRGGNVFGSMEYKILESKVPGVDNIQAAIYTIYKYIVREGPHDDIRREYDRGIRAHYQDPDTEFSTELGEIPHSDKKGSLDQRVRPFGYMYNYSLLRQ